MIAMGAEAAAGAVALIFIGATFLGIVLWVLAGRHGQMMARHMRDPEVDRARIRHDHAMADWAEREMVIQPAKHQYYAWGARESQANIAAAQHRQRAFRGMSARPVHAPPVRVDVSLDAQFDPWDLPELPAPRREIGR